MSRALFFLSGLMAFAVLGANPDSYCQKIRIHCTSRASDLGEAGAKAFRRKCTMLLPADICWQKVMVDGDTIDPDECSLRPYPMLTAQREIYNECAFRHECSHLMDDPRGITGAETEVIAYNVEIACLDHYQGDLNKLLLRLPGARPAMAENLRLVGLNLDNMQMARRYNLCLVRGEGANRCEQGCRSGCGAGRNRAECALECSELTGLYGHSSDRAVTPLSASGSRGRFHPAVNDSDH